MYKGQRINFKEKNQRNVKEQNNNNYNVSFKELRRKF